MKAAVQAGRHAVHVREQGDPLAFSQVVHSLFTLHADVSGSPGQRVSEVANCLGIKTHQVRRYLALALAPDPIKELLREGKLGARAVVLMQGLSDHQQLELAHRLIAVGASSRAARCLLEQETRGPDERGRPWSEAATALERSLLNMVDQLETLTDLPKKSLVEICCTAGGALGRRSFLQLVRQVIENAEILQQSLERIEVTKKGAAA